MKTTGLALCMAFLTLCLSQVPQKADNIGYLAMGYNIYKGNPLDTSVDPGFSVTPIFNLTYTQNQASPDGKYLLPDNVSIVSQAGCSLKSESTTISGATSYTKTLNVFASVDTGCPFGAFSASTDYKTIEESTSEQSTLYTLSNGQCTVYEADLTLMDLPNLAIEFVQNAISYLENSDSDMHYLFLDTYGTHYIQELTMGSRLTVMDSLSTNEWTSLESQEISVTVAAQLSFMGAYAGFNSGTTTQTTEMNSYTQSSSNFLMTTIGSVPPEGGNAIVWAQEAVTNPMPIQYSLTSISAIFNSTTFSTTVQEIASSETLQTIQYNLQAALDGNYCSYLLAQGTVATCSAPGPDQPIPVQTGSCVLCASGCGGVYSQSQGLFDVTQEQPGWLMDYTAYCADTSILQSNPYENGIDLCCRQEIPQAVQGSCRMCKSCGGQFNHELGSFWENTVIASPNIADGWLQAYGSSCEGNLQPEGSDVTSSGYPFCCDAPNVCALCQTCGGEYPNETGVFGVQDYSKYSFSFLGNGCSGSQGYQEVPGGGGFALCCAQ